MLNKIIIREMRKADIDFVVDSLIALQNHECFIHDSRKIGNNKICYKYFQEIYKNSCENGGDIFVASLDNKLVGFICFWIENDSSLLEKKDSNIYGYISDIYVKEEYRGKRIAQHLISKVENHLISKKSIKRLRVCSLYANTLAIRAYDLAEFLPYEIIYEKKLRA